MRGLGGRVRALVVLAVLLVPSIAGAAPAGQGEGAKPNIVLVLLDDLDAAAVAQMPNVGALLGEQGTSFTNYFVTTPLCCPSRASLLRGQYVHNHGTLHHGPGSGFTAFYEQGREESTVATWLQGGGYRTALYGKYLNGYPEGADPLYVPPGWDEWGSGTKAKEPYGGFDYELNENGTIVSYGARPEEYVTDVLAAKATGFVEGSVAEGRPFFLHLAPYAPHLPATPAPRHAEAFADAAAPRGPSFNEADVADKPGWVQGMPALDAAAEGELDERYRQRLRSLLAVDELVAGLVETLGSVGALENTFLFFTSDNGFHQGEHRLAEGKQTPYGESIRVPLLVRGPGVPAAATVAAMALNVDLGPTVAALAGVAAPEFVDGRSLAPFLGGAPPGAWRRVGLVEHFGTVDNWARHATRVTKDRDDPAVERAEVGRALPVPPYAGLRTAELLYVEYETGERELYDLRSDPHELENLAAGAAPATLEALAARLGELRDCEADGCRAAEEGALDPGSVGL